MVSVIHWFKSWQQDGFSLPQASGGQRKGGEGEEGEEEGQGRWDLKK